ncbi:MAG: hypothetical protein [Siphoviridae sp. ctCJE6]|nr:MAG: hypothetical protein [Siphoviridae sp. ctCJE6]
MKRRVLLAAILILIAIPAMAQTFFFWRYREHATDCTSLTDGKQYDLCHEQDSNNFYKCVPSAGDCDQAAEWKLITASLTADPAACTSGQYVTDISASGSLTCAQVAFSQLSGAATDGQIPDNITVTLAATATALAGNGANCSAGNYPLGVDPSGAVESCTADDDVPESGDFGNAAALESDGSLSADAVSALTQIDQGVKTAANDTSKVVVGTAGSSNEIAKWDANGNLIDANVIFGTMTDGKWCSYSSTGTLLSCTEDAPAGSGDVTSAGDCSEGACGDGSSDGGTYYRLYDGDSHYLQLGTADRAANQTINFATMTDAKWCKYSSTGTAMSCDVEPVTDTDSNANTICSGTSTYLDGEGNCDDLSTVYQPLDADLTTYAGITPAANVQSILGAADYAAIRALLDLEAGTDFYSVSAANAAFQPLDTDLTYLAGFTPSANVKTILNAADYAAVRTALGLVIGTNVQAYDADLTTYAGLTPSANAQTLLGQTFAQMQASLSIDDLITLSGVSEGSANLGTFTGTTISDSDTIKGALQDLETAVEAIVGGGNPAPISKTVENPLDSDNFIIFRADAALTISSINCIVENATSAVITVQECDSAGDNCAGVDGATTITCDVDGAADDGSLSNAAIDSGDWVRLDIGTVTGTVGHLAVSIPYTYD